MSFNPFENISGCLKDEIKYFIKDNLDCVWILKNKLGEGVSGEVYRLCCMKDNDINCKYVVKIQTGEKLEKFEKEIEMQRAFSDLKLGLPIIEAFICDKGSFIVMESRDTDLEKYVNTLVSEGVKSEDILDEINRAQEQFLMMIETAHSKKLVHDDIKPDNIMVNVDENGKWYDMVLIDFGTSKKVNSKQEADRLEDKDDIILSFDRLRKIARKEVGSTAKKPPEIKRGGKSTAKKRFYESPKKSPIRRGMMFDEGMMTPPRTPMRGLSFDDEGMMTPPRKPISFDDEDDIFSTPKKKSKM